MDIFFLFLSGAFGALVRDVLKDNRLVLPRVENGALVLGFIGGMIIGGMAGYVIDGSPLTACLGGFVGYQVISSLVPKDDVK